MKYPTLYYKSKINLKYVTSYFLTRMSWKWELFSFSLRSFIVLFLPFYLMRQIPAWCGIIIIQRNNKVLCARFENERISIRGDADNRAQVYTAEGRKVNIASPSNLSPCHRSSPPVCVRRYIRFQEENFWGSRCADACEDFLVALLSYPCTLTRAHELAKLYYKPESYTRALATESIYTRLILLPHIILNAHGRLTLLWIAKSQMIRNKAQI